jgi:hypothetical protein
MRLPLMTKLSLSCPLIVLGLASLGSGPLAQYSSLPTQGGLSQAQARLLEVIPFRDHEALLSRVDTLQHADDPEVHMAEDALILYAINLYIRKSSELSDHAEAQHTLFLAQRLTTLLSPKAQEVVRRRLERLQAGKTSSWSSLSAGKPTLLPIPKVRLSHSFPHQLPPSQPLRLPILHNPI